MTVIAQIDMPNMCGRCDMWDISLEMCRLLVQPNEDKMTIRKDCPLKSVDGLIEKIEKYGGNEEKSAYKNLHPSYTRGLKDAIKIIKQYCGMEENK